jgi:hypothetical protein
MRNTDSILGFKHAAGQLNFYLVDFKINLYVSSNISKFNIMSYNECFSKPKL